MQKKKMPTIEAYSELQTAYDFFNKNLFNSHLPECLIILNNKDKRACGYYVSKIFINLQGEHCDCIAMNPKYFAGYSLESIMQTLVHEMVHLWQANFAKPPRRGYHDKGWAFRMKEIGLMPSNTGQPGGKQTGQKMSDYVIDEGQFQKVCKLLLTTDFTISWRDRFPIKGFKFNPEKLIEGEVDPDGEEFGLENKSNRLKYICSQCKINVWGRPGLKIICGLCAEEFQVSGI